MVEVLELDDSYGIFDWPDVINVYHHDDYVMETRCYTYRKKSEADLLAENARLRELLMMAYKAATEPDCADCYSEHSCKNNDLSYCVMWVELEQKMRDELGIEEDL